MFRSDGGHVGDGDPRGVAQLAHRDGSGRGALVRKVIAVAVGTTSIYLQGIDPEEIIAAVRTRRAPMMSASAGPRL
jgi:hypothetical protein